MADAEATAHACCLVLTTMPDEAGAAALARALVEAGRGACVQIDAVRSVYRWQGQVCDEPEWRLTIKAVAHEAPALMQFVRERHPYEVPELICLPITAGEPAYLRWIAQSGG